MALAWVIKSDDVSTAIMGASRVEQVEQNLGALNVVDNLTPEVLGRIEEILGNRPSLPMNFRHNLNAPADSPMPIYGPSFRR